MSETIVPLVAFLSGFCIGFAIRDVIAVWRRGF
jgi:hypothetical protein